jgi:hypothetical protein
MDDRESDCMTVTGAMVDFLAFRNGQVVLERCGGTVGWFSVLSAVPKGTGQPRRLEIERKGVAREGTYEVRGT